MSLKLVALIAGAASILGLSLGYYLRLIISLGKKGSMELEIKEKELAAKEEAKKITLRAEEEANKILQETRAENKEKEEKIKKTEERLIKKEDLLDRRQQDIDREVEELKGKVVEIRKIKERADALEAGKQVELERIAHLSLEDAKGQLFATVEKRYEQDLLHRIQKLEQSGEEKLERRAKEIITTAIQRLGNAVSADILTTMVSIPSDEVKGKIIGKEGRNIKAFERATGVDVLIDDAPDRITLSSFDPLRRHIAKIALEKLIIDGRIQPTKIEETVKRTQTEVAEIVAQKGESAAYETGVIGLDPRLVALLGRLHFRTSYGQNVLQHSIEMAHIAGMLAFEIGADPTVARKGALLHDIGKAVDHEVQGTHVDIGRRLLEKFGVEPSVVLAMQSHHEEYPYETPEAIIVQVADAISAGRPGARRDTVDRYLERLGDLEHLAGAFEGVEKVYAIAAGREIRVFVNPGKVGDLAMHKLARDIAKRIQEELRYPGEIKVNIIRENRVVEFAR